ncbi:MarR family winged helix-turn-helix transcriptional regulator [Streptomyces drozdowiczii]|uniref:MarR family winged helix-turn-helix transcriptional regulator n=1 Tax=Streptomyces drozdowiczii TaxID=202862 RepID=UPI002245CF30|nr:MarR family transcriptional regulator [Streptomyces drozdowiczii]MCX0241567.1 MarR family transcriptional regulator [Streptomyces drozdowiczii]
MEPVEEVRLLVLAAQREGNRALASELRPLGLTPSQGEVLRLLAERQPLSLSGLGALLVCESGSNPSRLVDRLVTAGFVHREVDAHDRRHVELTLTDAGRHAAESVALAEGRLHAWIAEAATGHDLEQAREFLRALVTGRGAGNAVALQAATATNTDPATNPKPPHRPGH